MQFRRATQVKCQNCGSPNWLREYSLREEPKCGKCGFRLSEPIAMHLLRVFHKNPLLLSAAGAAIIIGCFFFLDRYMPSYGIIWNASQGTISGFPYRWILAGGLALIFGGIGIEAGKRL